MFNNKINFISDKAILKLKHTNLIFVLSTLYIYIYVYFAMHVKFQNGVDIADPFWKRFFFANASLEKWP